jgi:phosphoglycerate dehydrogenase-like enzyme
VKIVLNAPVPPEQVERIRLLAAGAEVVVVTDDKELEIHLPDTEVLVSYGFKLNRKIIEKAGQLRWVHALSTGVDAFLRLGLQERGIILTNSRGVHANQMTEHIFAFMLSFVRLFPRFVLQQRESNWKRWDIDTLAGKTLGIAGLGSIGQELARRAKAFNMTVIGTKKNPTPVDCVDEVLSSEELHRMLPRVDFLVIIVPSTKETHHLIGREELSLLKSSAYLINMARGDVVDQEALIEALKEKKIAGAGLDVTTPEPLPPDAELWTLDNVLITPHMGGGAPDYLKITTDIFCLNLSDYIKGDVPSLNLVDQNRGY